MMITEPKQAASAAAERAAPTASVVRTLNVPFLVGSVVTIAALSGSLYGIWQWQLRRMAVALLDRAASFEEDERWMKAAENVNYYLVLRPGDPAQSARLARLYSRQAATRGARLRAVELYYRAIAANASDEQTVLRRELGDLLLGLGSNFDAKNESQKILDVAPDDAFALRIFAIALAKQYDAGVFNREKAGTLGIIKALQRAQQSNPDDVELAIMLAASFRNSQLADAEIAETPTDERHRLADAIVDQLVAARSDDPISYLTRFEYRRRYKLDGAEADLAKAVELGPENLRVLSVAIAAERREGDRLSALGESHKEQAKAAYTRAMDHANNILDRNLAQEDPGLPVMLGELQLLLGEKDLAVNTWKQGIVDFPDSATLFHAHLCDLWLDVNKLDGETESSMRAIDAGITAIPLSTPKLARIALQRDQDLRWAVWYFQRNEIRKSIPLLQSVILQQQQLGEESRRTAQAWLLLGASQMAIGEALESATAYDRAAALLPRSAEARLSAAMSWLAASRPEIAADRAEQAIRIQPNAKAHYVLASVIYQQQVLLPPPERVWGRFELAIEGARSEINDGSLEEPWRLLLLRVDGEIEKYTYSATPEDGHKRAVEILGEGEKEYPETLAFWQTLPVLYQQLGQPANADQVIDRLRSLPDSEFTASIAHARLLNLRKDFDEAERVLAATRTDQPTEVVAIGREIVRTKIARRDFAGARKLLEDLLLQNPSDLFTLRQLADIDLNAENYADVEHWEGRMRAVPGIGEILAQYFTVRRLVATAKGAADRRLAEASSACIRLLALRPTWTEAVALQGIIHQRQGATNEAIASYQQAISLGESRLFVFEQLLNLLAQANRTAEGEKYLARLKSPFASRSHIAGSQDLTVFESTVDLRKNQLTDAIEVARQGVDRRPDDANAHLWLAKMLMLGDKNEDAEREFERAVALKPEDGRMWSGLFSFHLRSQDRVKSISSLERMATSARLTDAERSYVLAQGYEMLEDNEAAERHYEEARKQAPENTDVLLRMAGFFLRRNADRAEKCLREVLAREPQSGVARRTLAMILASRGADTDWQQASAMLDPSSSDNTSVVQDNRLRAILLVNRGGVDNILDATSILEELVVKPPAERLLADRLVLAQLYEKLARFALAPHRDDKRWRAPDEYERRCREQFITLCAVTDPVPAHLLAFVSYLLRHEKSDEAEHWLDKFQQFLGGERPPSPAQIAEYVRLRVLKGDDAAAEAALRQFETQNPNAVLAVTLRARLIKGRGDQAEAALFVEDAGRRLMAAAANDQERSLVVPAIGAIYDSLENLEQAEIWYRKLYQESPKTFEPLVKILVKRGKVTEAIGICSEATRADSSPRPALVVTMVVANAQMLSEDDKQQADTLIEDALARHGSNATFLTTIATLRIVQGRNAEAVQMYRKVIELKPRNVVALNNLAVLLSEQAGTRSEALQVIDKAIEIAGFESALLDTKGTILYLDDKSEQAIEYLKTAIAGGDSDPRYRFHLALAYNDLKAVGQARSELELALQHKLDKQVLTVAEQKLLSELRSILAPSTR